jgi:hypothetical protein
MGGAGVEVTIDEHSYKEILDALTKASMPDLEAIARFAGAELSDISAKAFKTESDPVGGAKWAATWGKKPLNSTAFRSSPRIWPTTASSFTAY